MSRPRPPDHLVATDGEWKAPGFEPAPELLEWVRATFLEPDSDLHNEDHLHLHAARIGILWTNIENARHGRKIVGQCEFRPPAGSMGKWARGRAVAQLTGWFGEVPDFLLTFDAGYAIECSDAAFCALVEHELYHCGQARDEFGAPTFGRDGMPVFAMRGHDVEEFTGIVRRYGADAAGVREFVEAAGREPEVAAADISRGRAGRVGRSCGWCGKSTQAS